MSSSLGSFYDTFLVPLNLLVLAYFLAVNGFYLVLFGSAALDLRRYRREVHADSHSEFLSSEFTPNISMLVPAYNEESSIRDSVRALLTLAYPALEIVVVDDGSTDGTLAQMVESFDLTSIRPIYSDDLITAPVMAIYRSSRFPNLIVAAKKNGGKADALNAALSISSGDLVCAVDADTIIDPDGLRRLVRPFIRSDDVVAAGATVRVANGCVINQGRLAVERAPRTALAGFQAVEYLRAFLFGRLGWNRLGGNLVISGAFGLFRRDSVVATGGYAHTVGEDMELIVRLRRFGAQHGRPSRVEFVPDPVAWTEAPSSLRVLGRQRDRWHRGLSDTLWKHRALFFNPRRGMLGLVSFPAFVLFEWLAPVIELFGFISVPLGLFLGRLNVPFAILFFVVAYGLGVLLSMLALLLEELSFRRYGTVFDRALLVGWALLENLGYRQLTLWWRLRGIVNFFRGNTEWGVMHRTGFATSAEPELAAERSGRE